MKVYFVRHGESKGNLARIHQTSKTELSETGLRQAHEVAKRFASIPINKIYTSGHVRAATTAKAIQQVLQKELQIHPLIYEIKRPTEIEGKSTSDPGVEKIKELIYKNSHDKNWRYSDEENIYDIQYRAEKFVKFLSKEQEESILVVSHGMMIRMIVGVMIFGDLLNSELFHRMFNGLKLHNTGLTLCEYNAGTWRDNTWRLITWNDHAHLG